jgi:hypothetical protein
MNATHSVRIGDEVFVYVRGRLVMKRWLKTGVSVMFNSFGLPTWNAEVNR